MRPLTSSAGPALRSWTKYQLPATRLASAVTAQQKRSATSGEVGHTTSFDSPFRTSEAQPSTTKIPSFKNYMSKSPEVSNRVFQYFVVGSMGLLAAAGAKATVQGALRTIGELPQGLSPCRQWSIANPSFLADFLVNMSASADVLAQAKVELDLAAIPEGKNVRITPATPSCH